MPVCVVPLSPEKRAFSRGILGLVEFCVCSPWAKKTHFRGGGGFIAYQVGQMVKRFAVEFCLQSVLKLSNFPILRSRQDPKRPRSSWFSNLAAAGKACPSLSSAASNRSLLEPSLLAVPVVWLAERESKEHHVIHLEAPTNQRQAKIARLKVVPDGFTW